MSFAKNSFFFSKETIFNFLFSFLEGGIECNNRQQVGTLQDKFEAAINKQLSRVDKNKSFNAERLQQKNVLPLSTHKSKLFILKEMLEKADLL